MDSGLGSDEEQRRSRTKEQKQRHNEQLLNGNGAHCFIDASSLQDDEVVPTSMDDIEQRRTQERRQGALLFQSSIPQYSTMLQLAGSSSTPPDTPFNSMVHIDHNYEEEACITEEVASKPSLGFYVDLNDVEVESTTSDTSATATKNIFSMVIDFEAPKKDMPSRLLRNTCRRKQTSKKQNCSNKQLENVAFMELQSEDTSLTSFTTEEVCEDVDNDIVNGDQESLEETTVMNDEEQSDDKENNDTEENGPTFVRLSDLMHQNAKSEDTVNDFVGPRMSRSIPESSWVESPLMMSRSAGYRIAPKPMEPDNVSLSDSTGSQTGPSQRRLGTDLLRMFLEEIDTDTVLHVGVPPRAIKAHRCILISRCQYFAGSLRARALTIEGFSYDAVHFALCHIYSGAAHVPDSISLVELASLADMLSLEGLKEVVAHALKSRHCHNFHSPCAGCLTGVLEVLPLSAAYGLDELYQRCLKWITINYLRVWPSRAFASLPKELRDKCYQQHIIHLSPNNVLETNLSCDRLIVSLPSLKWAESVVQLGLQLSHTCQTYVSQHYVEVLPNLVNMEPWNFPRLEEVLLNAANGLSLDQECHIYARCCNLCNKHKDSPNQTLQELLTKLKFHFEKRLLLKAHKLGKCPAWNKMDQTLRLHIKSLGKVEDTNSRSARGEPSRLPRMVTNKAGTSSSESSRNSSPAASQAHASPSLRRSLLLAARAPQVPPSPSTVRRVSTLTLPTAASAAKSTPARHIKSNNASSTGNNNITKVRPVTAPHATRKPATNKSNTFFKGTTAVKEKKENTSVSLKKEHVNKLDNSNISKRQAAINYSKKTKVHQNHVSAEKGKIISTKQKQTENDKQVTVPKSPGMQRSSTFLKEEPTVLTHPGQAQL